MIYKNALRRLSGLVIILIACFTAPAQSAFTSKVIGVGVVVSNLEKSLNFYVNGIGMVKAYSFTINEEFSKRSGL